MIRNLALVGLLLAADPLAAQEAGCPPRGIDPIEPLEQAKQHFLTGNYQAFYAGATPFVPQAAERYESVIGPLAAAFPDGFKSCTTILHRRSQPAMVQELVMFELKSGAGLLSLYLLAGRFDDETKIMQFSFSSDIEEALAKIR